MPARLMTRQPVMNGDTNYLMQSNQYTNNNGIPGGNTTQYNLSSPYVVQDNDTIDSAILGAIANPRERMHVLNLENQFVNFVKSR